MKEGITRQTGHVEFYLNIEGYKAKSNGHYGFHTTMFYLNIEGYKAINEMCRNQTKHLFYLNIEGYKGRSSTRANC